MDLEFQTQFHTDTNCYTWMLIIEKTANFLLWYTRRFSRDKFRIKMVGHLQERRMKFHTLAKRFSISDGLI
jgi:hypothetical protein